MDIQLNIQTNLVFAIIGALLFWQTMKLWFNHRRNNKQWKDLTQSDWLTNSGSKTWSSPPDI